jgi:hypothetical protein
MNDHSMDLGCEKHVYESPALKRIELAIDETLGAGCKVDTDDGCLGPPITAYNSGS